MKRIVTKGIVLTRTNYGEADRIINFLTPDMGLIGVMAKGVRKQKSKLAGGIELFSESDITLIKGKSEIYTLISSRLIKHYQNIARDIEKTMLGYDALKHLNKITREHSETEHYELLKTMLASLQKPKLSTTICELWFYARCLWVEGSSPNLASDTAKNPLKADKVYSFNYESMAFELSQKGQYNASHIKLLRISMGRRPDNLAKVITDDKKINQTLGLIKSIVSYSN